MSVKHWEKKYSELEKLEKAVEHSNSSSDEVIQVFFFDAF